MSILGRRELHESLGRATSFREHITTSTTPYKAAPERTPTEMSQSKRPANDAFGSNQLVKRAKSDANLDSTAVAISSGTGQNGALIRAVCLLPGPWKSCASAERRSGLTGAIGTARRCSSVASHGIDRAFWGGLCSTIRSYRPVHCLRLNGSFHSSVCQRNGSTTCTNTTQCFGEVLAHAKTTAF